jgi:hypothetical protein
MKIADKQLYIDEIHHAAAMLRHACKLGIAQLQTESRLIRDIPQAKRKHLAAELRNIIEEHERIWLKRNRIGGLSESESRLKRLLEIYLWYVPLDLFEARIEAEDVIDLNSCSDAPLDDGTGIRIQDNPTASGGQQLGYASAGAWCEYTVDVPATVIGTPVDVYVRHATSGSTPSALQFGTVADAAAYGTTALPATGGWTFSDGWEVGQVTFTVAGPQTVRTTYTDGINLDWFSFDF